METLSNSRGLNVDTWRTLAGAGWREARAKKSTSSRSWRSSRLRFFRHASSTHASLWQPSCFGTNADGGIAN